MEFIEKYKNDAKILAILANIHLFVKLFGDKIDKEKIIDQVMKKDPHFSKEDCEECWNYLKQFGLI
jgi:hypothetical protein